MKRREFLKQAALSALPIEYPHRLFRNLTAVAATSRRWAHPGEPSWPTEGAWNELSGGIKGQIIKLQSPLSICKDDQTSGACDEVLKRLHSPFHLSDQPALTQTSGWANAWISSPSIYAVIPENAADVSAAVRFASQHNIRLVVKGGGHSYQGTSNAPDSLLIWTRSLNEITFHNAFVGTGCESLSAPQPAVTLGAGLLWMDAYRSVTTEAGRYVQGGGCTTVGVAGLIQSGGFGSFSKKYGLAAAGLLEAEIVTADGRILIANSCNHADLFWGLKGGGGGSLGVVTTMTLRTHALPEFFGGVFGVVKATSEAAYRQLVGRLIAFYSEELFNPTWGEQMRFLPGHRVEISMVFQGIDQQRAIDAWSPLINWVSASPKDYQFEQSLKIITMPARHFWDPDYLKTHHPEFIVLDDRPETKKKRFVWAGDLGEAGQYIYAYQSAWLPATLLAIDRRSNLCEALVSASQQWGVSLHFNKGLAGASKSCLAEALNTAINPAATGAFALAISASHGPPSYLGIPGHEPDHTAAQRDARNVEAAMNAIRALVPNSGSYVSESDFFQSDWQQSYWGSNYARLLAVKHKYDPTGLFFAHHGVGSED